ncbi:MAG: hypothetical protein ACLRYB_08025 [Segatella copri]
MDKNLMNDMDKNLMDVLYVSYNEKFGVLSDDEDNTISHVLGTDLTLVLDKKDMAVYLLVPLTRNHKFECKGNYIIVDGKRFDSDIFFRKYGCQWIQMQSKEMLSMVV